MRVPIQYSNPPAGEKKKDFRDHIRHNPVDHTSSRGHFSLLRLLLSLPHPLRLEQGRWKPDVKREGMRG